MSFLIFLFSFLNYISLPFLFNRGYTQLLPFLLLNIYLIFLTPHTLINKYINLLLIISPFLVYASFIYFDFQIFYKYIISIFQLANWLILVILSRKNLKISISLYRVFLYLPFIVLLTQFIQILSPELFAIINLFKSDSIQKFGTVARGFQGILPEAGYVGALISTSVVGFFVSKKILEDNFKDFKLFLNKNFEQILYKNKSIHFFVSFLSILLSLSAASYISSIMILSFFFICKLISQSKTIKKSIKFKNILVILILFCFIFNLSFNRLKDKRIFNLSKVLISRPYAIIRGLDASTADRFNASFVGLVTPIIHPQGYGINAFPRIFRYDCNHPIPRDFNLMCESMFNSLRNNNILANFTQDGGIIGLLTIISILFYISGKTFINIKKLIISSGVLILGLILPFPLGASTFWVLTVYLFSI